METIVHTGSLKRNCISRTDHTDLRSHASWLAKIIAWYRLQKLARQIREEMGFLNYLTKIHCPHLAESQQKYIEQLTQEYHAAGGKRY